MIPPYAETRMEVHGQWEEILLNKLGDIRFPSIKILNMAKVMLMYIFVSDKKGTEYFFW